MIIPTFRIGNRDNYAAMAKCYQEHDISLLRVNMVRHSLEVYCEEIDYFRNLMESPLEIMADIPLPGSKYRLGIPNETEIPITKGQEVVFTKEKNGLPNAIPVMVDSFSVVSKGEKIIIGDGELTLTVTEAENQMLKACADNTARIRGQRSFAVPDSLSYQNYSSVQLENYVKAFRCIKPSKIVLSFSEDIEILTTVKTELEKMSEGVELIPKIETQKGVDTSNKICGMFREIMLGRGDLALFSNPVEFGENQKRVITTAQEQQANVIVATDILSSLYSHNIPTRADLSDLYYLYEMGIQDVVASAGISMIPEWFSKFCAYAETFK